MKVLFLKDVSGRGKKGEVKEINDGYVRNFLIPQNLVVLADSKTIKKVEKEKKEKEKSIQNRKQEVFKLLDSVNNKKVTIKTKANELGHLFAKIHSEDVAIVVFKQLNVELEKSWIEMVEMKEVGEYKIKISFDEHKANLSVYVEKE
jgi:large subunit ribosomal protein L9